METIKFVPDRLNAEPVIFIGMSQSELKWVTLIALMFWVPGSLIVSLISGGGIIGLGVGVVLAFASVWWMGKKLRVLKRDKPAHYHINIFRAWLEDRGLKAKTMIRENAVWDLNRSPKRFERRFWRKA